MSETHAPNRSVRHTHNRTSPETGVALREIKDAPSITPDDAWWAARREVLETTWKFIVTAEEKYMLEDHLDVLANRERVGFRYDHPVVYQQHLIYLLRYHDGKKGYIIINKDKLGTNGEVFERSRHDWMARAAETINRNALQHAGFNVLGQPVRNPLKEFGQIKGFRLKATAG